MSVQYFTVVMHQSETKKNLYKSHKHFYLKGQSHEIKVSLFGGQWIGKILLKGQSHEIKE